MFTAEELTKRCNDNFRGGHCCPIDDLKLRMCPFAWNGGCSVETPVQEEWEYFLQQWEKKHKEEESYY